MPKKTAPSQKERTSVEKKRTSKTLVSSPKTKVVPRKVEAEILDDNVKTPHLEPEREGLQPLEEIYPEFDESLAEPVDTIDTLDSAEVVDSHLPAPVSPSSLKSTDPLVMYLQEIRKYPVLSREEEMKIAKKYFEDKDPKLAQKLVQSNLRFVVKVAAEYSKFGTKMIDLIQEGNVGLMHAVRDFNPYKGARLITYAVWWIRGYIQEYLMRQYSMVRIGTTQNQRKLFYQLQKHKEILSSARSAEQIKALSQELNIPAEEIEVMAQRLSSRDTSLDRKIDEASGTTLLDLQKTSNDEPLDEALARLEQLELLKEKIEDIRPQLNEKELILLDERILNDQPLTLQEIGEKYGITREAVRQTEARLIKKIKDRMLGTNADN